MLVISIDVPPMERATDAAEPDREAMEMNSVTSADRRFRPGDVVRLTDNSPFWHELKDKDLTVVEVEPDPPAMGYNVVWVEGKQGGLPATEFVLVKPCDD